MASFKFTSLVTESVPISSGLGVDPANKLTDLDSDKGLKLAGDNNYVLCEDGDDIEGTLVGVEAHTVNQGFGFGTVKVDGRVPAIVSGGALAIGDYVVAAAQTAANTAGSLEVKAGAGAVFKWRVISNVSGAGAVGDTVLIERV